MEKTAAVMREKQILTQLTGVPGVVQIKQTFMDTNNLYFVFEHLPWGTLADLIKAEGKNERINVKFRKAE